MAADRTRERIIELTRIMREKTVANGCTPGEAAKFAAKVSEWIERYQIEERELRQAAGEPEEELEVCQNTLRTGKRVFNPGMTAVLAGLVSGMSCRLILLKQSGEAVYGIIGEQMDADYVCQIATYIVPELQTMARLEGIEHGHEKAGLIRWANQYLQGAGDEIRRRLLAERKARSEEKEAEHKRQSTALMCVTGESLAIEKKAAADDLFKKMYPKTRQTFSRSQYDGTAVSRGREAGKQVGLNLRVK